MPAQWRAAVLLLSAALAGCQSTGSASNNAATAQVGHLPPNYRQTVAQEIKTSPEYQTIGIKDAQISNPILEHGAILNGGVVASVCVRYRGRGHFQNEYGNSFVADWFSFTKGNLNRSGMRARRSVAWISCNADRIYTPFAEIEHD